MKESKGQILSGGKINRFYNLNFMYQVYFQRDSDLFFIFFFVKKIYCGLFHTKIWKIENISGLDYK